MTDSAFAFGLGVGTHNRKGDWLEVYFPRPLLAPSASLCAAVLAQLIQLLDVSSQAEGVRIYIGGESQVVPYQELSVVTAPYEVDGQVVGTLGVIGPMRMPYEKMIQIVDITSRLVSSALSHSK